MQLGTTIGDAGASQSVFTDVNNKDLSTINFVPLFFLHLLMVLRYPRVMKEQVDTETVFTLLAGTTGDLDNVDSALSGAIFGATSTPLQVEVGGSAFEEFCPHSVTQTH